MILKLICLIIASFLLGMLFSYYSFPCGIDVDCLVKDITTNYDINNISLGIGLIPIKDTNIISFRGMDFDEGKKEGYSVCFKSIFKEYRANESILKESVLCEADRRLKKCLIK